MKTGPLPVLRLGYGSACGLALILWLVGAPTLAALGVAWIGGAAATLAFAVAAPAARRATYAPDAGLADWEADRLADGARQSSRRAETG